MERTLEAARAWFAEDLRVAAGISSEAVVNAFARVPREKFIGPPPWRVGMRVGGMGAEPFGYRTFGTDPSVLYHDVIVALDEKSGINNGQPSLWARLFDELDLQPGARVFHLGCGTGYYSAVLAEIVGAEGTVHAVEIDDRLAARARDSLLTMPRVSVACGDGAMAPRECYDAIIVSAGVAHPLDGWLDRLAPRGRLLFPLTMDGPDSRWGNGAMLLISRTGERALAVRFLGAAGFVHFRGGRNPEANERLLAAFRNGIREIGKVCSLRRDEHLPDETCWLHAPNFCLSFRDPF
jgi:protein-L-isoaspartate(D-aspartate) O-methyltransferase